MRTDAVLHEDGLQLRRGDRAALLVLDERRRLPVLRLALLVVPLVLALLGGVPRLLRERLLVLFRRHLRQIHREMRECDDPPAATHTSRVR